MILYTDRMAVNEDYAAPDTGALERTRDQHRKQLALEAREIALTPHDHRPNVDCRKCELMAKAERADVHPNMPACPNCDRRDGVDRDRSQYVCSHCNLAFRP